MAHPSLLSSLLLALLIASASAGTVTLSNSNTVTVSDPLTISLSSSYSLSDGYTWNRQRRGSYSKFAEFYTLSVQSACVIKCGPFSWPVISGGKLYCERSLNYFTKNQPYTNNAYKALCIPNVSTGSGDCAFATYGIHPLTSNGLCDESSLSSYGGTFDCCNNNNNRAENSQYNEFSDVGATI